jgi:FixJ family two-component response regulator
MNQRDHFSCTSDDAVVYILDGSRSTRETLAYLLESLNQNCRGFGTIEALLEAYEPARIACLLLDCALDGSGGVGVQARLERVGVNLPLIFMSRCGDVPMAVRAMKAGAVDFLTVPICDRDLLDAVQRGQALDRLRRRRGDALEQVMQRFKTLTPRERQVMSLVGSGLMNKQAAQELSLSEISVKIHRGNVMRKMGAKTLADLVRMNEMLGSHALETGGATHLTSAARGAFLQR